MPTFKPPANVFCPIPFPFILFRTLWRAPKLNPFVFSRLRTLYPKTPGGGVPATPPWRTKMKPQPDNSSALSTRCQFHTSSSRQCRLFTSDHRSPLRSYHLAAEQQTETANVYAPLITNSHGLHTAQAINHSLTTLYELLPQNHISP